jgi:hypothetical protein
MPKNDPYIEQEYMIAHFTDQGFTDNNLELVIYKRQENPFLATISVQFSKYQKQLTARKDLNCPILISLPESNTEESAWTYLAVVRDQNSLFLYCDKARKEADVSDISLDPLRKILRDNYIRLTGYHIDIDYFKISKIARDGKKYLVSSFDPDTLALFRFDGNISSETKDDFTFKPSKGWVKKDEEWVIGDEEMTFVESNN